MDRLTQLQRIFREVFDDEELRITPETSQKNLAGWDSVSQLKIILTVEAELGMRFETEEVSSARSVAEMLAVIQRHLGS